MLGCGFRMFGSGAADILYTRYNLRNVTIAPSGIAPYAPHTAHIAQNHVGALRPHMEVELGFGYETYLDCCKWHMDLAASYGFQVFWDQDMFLENTNTALPTDGLQIHGLTITASTAF